MLAIENKLNSLQLFYIFAVKEALRACLHEGGGPQVGEVTRPVFQLLKRAVEPSWAVEPRNSFILYGYCMKILPAQQPIKARVLFVAI